MIDTEERQIGDHMWTVGQFTASIGLRLWTRLIKLVGPSLGTAAAAFGEGLDTEFDASILGKAVEELTKKLDENDVLDLVQRLLSQTQIDNRKVNFDLDFAGNYMELLKVLLFVLEVNYKSFFSGLPSGAQGVLSQLGTADQSLPT